MAKKNKVFHGCLTKNKDSTNCISGWGEQCLTPTSRSFWKYPEDISSCVRTHSQEKKQKKVTKREFDKYFKEKDIQRWLEADDSEVVILDELDTFYVVQWSVFWLFLL